MFQPLGHMSKMAKCHLSSELLLELGLLSEHRLGLTIATKSSASTASYTERMSRTASCWLSLFLGTFTGSGDRLR